MSASALRSSGVGLSPNIFFMRSEAARRLISFGSSLSGGPTGFVTFSRTAVVGIVVAGVEEGEFRVDLAIVGDRVCGQTVEQMDEDARRQMFPQNARLAA